MVKHCRHTAGHEPLHVYQARAKHGASLSSHSRLGRIIDNRNLNASNASTSDSSREIPAIGTMETEGGGGHQWEDMDGVFDDTTSGLPENNARARNLQLEALSLWSVPYFGAGKSIHLVVRFNHI
jgi:hypothetical protein